MEISKKIKSFCQKRTAPALSIDFQRETTHLEARTTRHFWCMCTISSLLWIIISFSQHPKLDLLQFFITFSTCFLALLLIAAILWKIKQKYDRYRRRQRLYVEMEQMASRPFGQVLTELERIPESESSHHSRKRRKKSRPSPIALEPCAGNRAAVLSLIVRMPTGGHSHAPPGTPGIAIASSLVTLGNPRKVSVDPTQKLETDSSTKSRKSRKVVAANQPTDL